ncbi:hypothetical protein BB560_002675 [Smittium megazygosporum]|uniref:HMG box domain-containing protein n=1 Tax=Smittium megazygosporum TaxID=133381 RepID=A0A2T9ZE43_9FUNG|nr:hypothetical protein BB560_002679 [Smittium megazygosporum]PVV02860.1 hypothetical protein BB560_002675 [Smittium megazygosporum]
MTVIRILRADMLGHARLDALRAAGLFNNLPSASLITVRSYASVKGKSGSAKEKSKNSSKSKSSGAATKKAAKSSTKDSKKSSVRISFSKAGVGKSVAAKLTQAESNLKKQLAQQMKELKKKELLRQKKETAKVLNKLKPMKAKELALKKSFEKKLLVLKQQKARKLLEEKKKKAELLKRAKEKAKAKAKKALLLKRAKALMSKNREKRVIEEKLDKQLNSIRKLIHPPSITKISGRIEFMRDRLNSLKSSMNGNASVLTSSLKTLHQEWTNLDPKEKERYNVIAESRNSERLAKAREWWSKADLNMVKLENKRRKNLNVARKAQGKHPLHKIANPFAEKVLYSPFSFFISEFSKNSKLNDSLGPFSLAKAATTWNSLSEAEKETYRSAHAKYLQEKSK